MLMTHIGRHADVIADRSSNEDGVASRSREDRGIPSARWASNPRMTQVKEVVVAVQPLLPP
jgi:hypothetical protein